MVSSALDMTNDELLVALERLRATSQDDAEYIRLRRALPEDWPL